MPAITINSKEFYDSAVAQLKVANQEQNLFSLSTIDKVSINVGVGKFESKEKTEISDYLEKLTGQKPKAIESKKSIAGFKLRKGDIVGYSVTLRGKKMQDFLLSLIYIALPRSRDFKGVKQSSFDKSYSCYSLGIENAGIFPSIGFDSGINFGMQINISFKHRQEQNLELLNKLNFPFKK